MPSNINLLINNRLALILKVQSRLTSFSLFFLAVAVLHLI